MTWRAWCLAVAVCGSALGRAAEPAPWPAITQTAKPWTRWWWPGSAVDRAQLTAQLEAFAAAGIGGVEITPIYGARGAESRYIDYLSPEWVEMLAHVTREARRLGLGVDMATGTGWPFGGPQVAPEEGAQSLVLIDGRLSGKPTDMKVKRPAPGGEGLVLDPYSTRAMERYLERFTQALGKLPREAVRSQFHDSFEYFNASWSPELPRVFAEMHGYDLQRFAAELAGQKPLDADTLGRIKGDYRRTLVRMHLDYMQRWSAWAHGQGFQVRNQAHGAPGGLLDLYGASDIPETESFGATRFPFLAARDSDIAEDPDPAVGLIGRFASSAAHVNGRPLVSSETLTWLRDNFRESPAAAKPQLDRLFVAGINHLFYHGSTYSPADAAWPGWFFYAASQLNPSNPWWRDFGAMNDYVARVQSVLQAGRPDNDILLYWPEADLADDAEGLMRQQGMHENAWLVKSEAGQLALALLQAGASFDLVSDAQLRQLRVAAKGVVSAPGGGRYHEIIIPRVRRMPVETLQALVELRAAGASLSIDHAPPADVPGFGRLAERRERFRQLLPALADNVSRHGVMEVLGKSDVARESMVSQGLWFTRRARGDGFDYFIVNPTASSVRQWVQLGRKAAQAAWLDPRDGTSGAAALRPGTHRRPQLFVQLRPGESLILRTWDAASPTRQGAPWAHTEAAGEPVVLAGPWRIEFLAGGPKLPAAATLPRLAAWTDLPDPDVSKFSGTARYRVEFDAPASPAPGWMLDLGQVHETARVTLNGHPLGTVWSLPATLPMPSGLKPAGNLLEIEVSNLAANRVRDLDRSRTAWKIMKDTNLVTLRYRPFDASTWEVAPSGLVGPVRLVPLKPLNPARISP